MGLSSTSSPKEAVDVNINGALNVLTAVEKCRGRARVFLPAKPNEWNNIYSVTSQAVEKLGHTYRDVYGLDIRILRIRNVYGPGQALYPVRKFVPYCISRALNHEIIEIFGDGTQEVELLYVSDVARLVTRYMFFEGDVRQTHEIIAIRGNNDRRWARADNHAAIGATRSPHARGRR